MINNKHSDYTEEMQRFQEYIEALEEENRKIHVFQRELPLCQELVTQAIERCRQQLLGQTESSEETSSERPVLGQFIPIKRTSSSQDCGQQSHKPNNIGKNRRKDSKSSDKSSNKSDWLRSVQLWNQTPDAPIKEESPTKVSVGKSRASMRRSHAFAAAKAVASSSTETGGSSGGGGGDGGGNKSEHKGWWQRKARRTWTPELHRKFLEAIQQLGGSDVAAPKQIRELMKVDELSNDEVKSHLQKYRLHSRTPSPSIHNNHHQPPPQFVVVGGLWLPPPQCAVVAAPTASERSIPDKTYAPRAALPPPFPQRSASLNRRQQHKPFHSAKRGSPSEGGAHSNSPATSSSMHTTTASLGF